jgi:hypothetical protein
MAFAPLVVRSEAVMRNVTRAGVFLFVLWASCLPFAQQPSTPVSPNAPAQQNPANPQSATPGAVPIKPGATEPHASEPGPPPITPPKGRRTPKEQAWLILDAGCKGSKTSERVIAIRVLGLVPGDPKALKVASKALADEQPEVRLAAAAALGDIKSKSSIPKLRQALDDKDPSVVLAAAHSLELMHDNAAYGVYYAVLTGERKTGKGLIASKRAALKDPKRMAQIGFEEGIGFIPFAGIGWGAIKEILKDDSSPVRAAAAKILAKDPDPATTKALADAAGDKSWLVRAAALEALARRGDSSALDVVKLYMFDEKDPVKYTAAATVLRLTAIRGGTRGGKGQEVKSRK